MIRKPSIARVERDYTPSTDMSPKPNMLAKYLLTFVIVTSSVSIVSAAGTGLYARSQFKAPTAGTVAMTTDEVQTLVDRVGAHIVIKTDEKPTIATIQDAAILRTQNPDFYKDAQNGDRLLIWSDKAVLYSATSDKLLAVLPIRIPTASTNVANAATTANTQPVENPTIEVRNGSKTTGLAKAVAEKITAAGLNVSGYATAKKTGYPTTLIITAAGKSLPNTVSRLETLIGGKAGALPSSEIPMKGDILVLVGADYQK